MLSNYLLTWYLFLGGAGAGLYLAAYVAIAINCLKPQPLSSVLMGKVWPRCLIVAIFALACGSVCLLKDLSRSGQAFYLLIKPTLSAISIGAYSLIALVGCLVVLLAIAYRRHDAQHLRTTLVVGGISSVLAIVVILYTGVLLQSIAAVPFWQSSLVVAIFAASSLSAGIGCFAMTCASVFGKRTLLLNEYDLVLTIDTIVIAFEAIAIIAFTAVIANEYGIGVFANFAPGGGCFHAFWIGVFLVGISLPLLLYHLPFTQLSTGYSLFLAATCCSVTSAFFVRYCFIFGAAHIASIILLGV